MFPIITKNKYVLFSKVEGFTKLPSDDTNELKEVYDNDEKSDIQNKSTSNLKVELNAGQDTGDDGDSKVTYICCSLLLENQIAKSLNLNKLGVYKLGDTKTTKIIKDISIINLTSKSSAVKSGFISYWKASFYSTSPDKQTDFKNTYTLSFITPSYVEKSIIEKHLSKNASIKPTTNSPTFKYTRSSLERITGRKYKI